VCSVEGTRPNHTSLAWSTCANWKKVVIRKRNATKTQRLRPTSHRPPANLMETAILHGKTWVFLSGRISSSHDFTKTSMIWWWNTENWSKQWLEIEAIYVCIQLDSCQKTYSEIPLQQPSSRTSLIADLWGTTRSRITIVRNRVVGQCVLRASVPWSLNILEILRITRRFTEKTPGETGAGKSVGETKSKIGWPAVKSPGDGWMA